MNRFLMSPKTVLSVSMIITLVTRIFYSFMNGFLVFFKIALFCYLIITIVTKIYYTFMNRFLMSFKTVLSFSMIFTFVTRIFYTFMNEFLVFLVAQQLNTYFCVCVCLFVCLYSVFDMKQLSIQNILEYSKREREISYKKLRTQTTNKYTNVRN